MVEYTNDYLLNKKVKIFQPVNGYRASTDAVLLSSLPAKIKCGDTILDVGSGTGAVSLCLAQRLLSLNLSITGLEIQPELAELSNLSAQANGFANFLRFINCDINHKTNNPEPCSFHHVITNPPYSLEDMPSPNSGKSTAHNFHNSDLSSWIKFCLRMLRPQGYFYMVNRAEALTEILTGLNGKAGNIQIIPVYSKNGQKAKRVLISAQKDSKAPAVILPSLIIHTNDGKYSPAAENILRLGINLFDAV